MSQVLVGFKTPMVASTPGSLQEQQRRIMPPFTDQPTEIYYGENPARDADLRGGLWTDKELKELHLQVQENHEAWGAVDAGMTGRVALISFVGSGAGESMPWERTFGGVNTNTGNKLTTMPIVSWPIRGGRVLGFALIHSSKSNSITAAGYGWTMSYDVAVQKTYNDLDQLTGANVYWDDGTIIHFTYHTSTPHYTPPAGIYDALVQNTGSTWTLTKKDQTKWNFNSSGYATSWVDRAGNTITMGRDGANKITLLTDPTSRQLVIAYDTSNRIRTITDPASRVWTISHGTSGDITDVAYPSLGGTVYHRTFGYGSSHAITSMVDLRGKTWSWGYDTNNSCTYETDPLNHSVTYTYTSSACTITMPGGQTTVDNYSSGRIASRVDEASYSTGFSNYDSNHNAQTVTDERGQNWICTFDSAGNILTKKDPLLHIKTLTYNSTNDPLTVKDHLNNTTTLTNNSAGQILTITDPLGRAVQTNTYDSYGRTTTTKNAMNEQSSCGYNTNGDLTTVTDPLTRQTSMSYDVLGRQTTVTDPLNQATSMSYDVEMLRLSDITPIIGELR